MAWRALLKLRCGQWIVWGLIWRLLSLNQPEPPAYYIFQSRKLEEIHIFMEISLTEKTL